jgi:hypothetical protein
LVQNFILFISRPYCKRGEIKSYESSARERNFLLAMILATETVEMNVRLFILMRGANIKVFSYFEIAKKNRSDLGKIFLFQVDFEF